MIITKDLVEVSEIEPSAVCLSGRQGGDVASIQFRRPTKASFFLQHCRVACQGPGMMGRDLGGLSFGGPTQAPRREIVGDAHSLFVAALLGVEDDARRDAMKIVRSCSIPPFPVVCCQSTHSLTHSLTRRDLALGRSDATQDALACSLCISHDPAEFQDLAQAEHRQTSQVLSHSPCSSRLETSFSTPVSEIIRDAMRPAHVQHVQGVKKNPPGGSALPVEAGGVGPATPSDRAAHVQNAQFAPWPHRVETASDLRAKVCPCMACGASAKLPHVEQAPECSNRHPVCESPFCSSAGDKRLPPA